MANPIFNATSEIKQLYNAICYSSNPTQAFMSIARNNPNLSGVVDMLRNGANPERLARQLLQNNGINPDDFVRNLTSR